MRFETLSRQLMTQLPDSDTQKSSHWQLYTSDRELRDDGTIRGVSGFGARAKRTIFHQFVHNVLQRRVVGASNPVFRSPGHTAAKEYTRLQRRALDMDVLRHVCTMELLASNHQRMDKPRRVAVIGDGQTNFVAASLASGLYDKVVSINLVDVLLSDLELLSRLPAIEPSDVCMASSKTELDGGYTDSRIRLILVPAHQAHDLGNVGFDLVVNIVSFQEMTPKIVDGYFQLIRENRAWHYNCNRLLKTLPGGEVLDYNSWDWGNTQTLLDELCPWNQHWYTYTPPFIRPYDGPVQHRLAKF